MGLSTKATLEKLKVWKHCYLFHMLSAEVGTCLKRTKPSWMHASSKCSKTMSQHTCTQDCTRELARLACQTQARDTGVVL